jgi:dolichol kinase
MPTADGASLAHELLAAALIGGAFIAVFVGAELWKRLADPPVEWTRKSVHFFGGLVAATFPWVFDSRWTVIGLALTFLAIIWGTRRLGLLGSVHGVERKSEGGIWYPLAVLLVFLVGHDRPVFYLIAILALVVSDTLAALVGSAYGRQAYMVESDRRSLEGSVVFLLTTFLVTHLPLLLMAELDPVVSVLIAVQVAILVTQFEAISLRGNDNFLVPVATFYLLLKMTPRGAEHLAGQLVAQLVIIAVIGVVAWRSWALTFSGAMTMMLFAYGLWGLGGPEWIVAPGLAFVGFIAVRQIFADEVDTPPGRYQVVAIFYICIVATLLFIANNTLETLVPHAPAVLREGDPFYAPFIGVVAAQMALVFMAQLEPFAPGLPFWTRTAFSSVAAAILLIVPVGLAAGPGGLTQWGLLMATGVTLAAAAIYRVGRRVPAWPRETPWNVRLQALSTGVVTAVAVPVQLWWLGVL